MLFSIRVGCNDHFNPEYIDLLINSLKKFGHPFDEVWLASSYGLPTINQCQEHSSLMEEAAKKFDGEGIVPSMQLSRTMGHGENLLLVHGGLGIEGLDLEPLTSIDGYKATGKFCWNDEKFRNYIIESTKAYVSFKPRIVWIDDDIRTNHIFKGGKHLCFCNKCLKRFNEIYGYSFTREKIREEFLNNSLDIRKEYTQFQVDTLSEFVEMIAKAIHVVSPDTVVALQNGGLTNLSIQTQKQCFDAIKNQTKLAPAFRCGGGFYDDHNPFNMIDKCMEINFSISRLPDYVKMRSCEIENLPFVAYGKSSESSCIEAAMYIAYGCNMASITLMNHPEPFSYYEEMFKKLSIYKPYLQKNVDYNANTKNSGVCIYQSPKSFLTYMKKGNDTDWNASSLFEAKELIRQGIPFHTGIEGNAYFLSSKACDYLCQDDIEHLLKVPVVTDAQSLEKIINMGYEESIYASVEKLDNKYMNTFYETMLVHPINEGLSLEKWVDSRFYSPDPAYIIKGEKIEKVSEYKDYVSGESVGCAFAIVETVYGAKWVVKGAHLCNTAVSFSRRNQTINAINYITENKLAAYVITPHQTVIVPRVNQYNQTVNITVLNVSITDSENMEIIIDNPANKEECIILDPYCGESKVRLTEKDGKYIASIGDLAPWRVKSIMFE